LVAFEFVKISWQRFLLYKDFIVVVFFMLTAKPLEIILPLKETEVQEGDTVTFTCEVNKPNVKARWFKDKTEIFPDENCDITSKDKIHTLIFKKANLDDEADYTVTLEDKKSTALLLVEEEPLKITKPHSDAECLEGETVSFVCEVNKENHPAMWLKDGVVITEEDGYEFIMDGKRHILKIPDTTIEHEAEFTVKINGCESKAKLKVEEVAADFTASLKDVEGREGESVELECTLSKPNVKVKWLKDRKPLTPSERIKIVCDRYRHYLRIMDSIPEDEGEYTVVLPSNKESTANLKIYETPQFFTMPLEDQELPEKEMAIFETQMSKKNIPVTWFKDGKEVVLDNRIEAITDGFIQQLVIDDCRLSDIGRYKCVMKEAETSARLKVQELPVEIVKPLKNQNLTEGDKLVLEAELSKPNYPVTWKKDGKPLRNGKFVKLSVDECVHRLVIDEADLEDEAKYSIHASDKSSNALVLVEEAPVEIIKPPKDQNIKEKESFTFECELSKPGVKVNWLKDGSKVYPADGFKAKVNGTVHTLTKDDAMVEDAGKYTMAFEDKKTTANLGVEAVATSFVRQLANITVLEHQSLVLECEVSKPNKPAKWFKNGQEVSASFRVKLTADGKIHKLMIDDAKLDDKGQYKVQIDGVESEATVLVEEEPIQIIKPLKNIEIDEFQTAKFVFEVSKSDIVGVWTCKDKPISPKEGHDIKVRGKVHTLTMDNVKLEEAGSYGVKVLNAESTAQLKVRGNLSVNDTPATPLTAF
jgi:hypothetical protein